jgi:Uma2 family endonuclease
MILKLVNEPRIFEGMSTTDALQSILGSHWLPEIAQKINEKLAAEAALREKFFDEVTESQKAEFIDGAVVVHSPARAGHIEVSDRLLRLIAEWVDRIGGRLFHEKSLCVFSRNAYEPDLVYFGEAKAATIDDNTLKFPVPDFVVEVLSDSTEKIDRGVKFEDYAAHGVREYWIVDSREQTLEQYLLGGDGAYKLKLKSAKGDVTSEVLTGLTLPIGAIFDAGAFRAAMKTLAK